MRLIGKCESKPQAGSDDLTSAFSRLLPVHRVHVSSPKPSQRILAGVRYRAGAFLCLDLLSNDLVIMAGVHLEGAIVSPQVDRVCDACNAALVDLCRSA